MKSLSKLCGAQNFMDTHTWYGIDWGAGLHSNFGKFRATLLATHSGYHFTKAQGDQHNHQTNQLKHGFSSAFERRGLTAYELRSGFALQTLVALVEVVALNEISALLFPKKNGNPKKNRKRIFNISYNDGWS